MGALDAFLNAVTEKAPWIVDLFVWLSIAGILLLVWLIAGFLILLVERFVRGKREDYGRFVEGLIISAEEYKKKNDEMAAQHLREFVESHRHHAFADLTFSYWNNPIRKAAKAAIKIERRYSMSITKLGKRLIAVLDKLHSSVQKVNQLKLGFPDVTNQIPDPAKIKETHESEYRIRMARRNWLIYSFLLVALLLINTIMMSQILKGLQVGLVRLWGSLWLYHVIGFLVTVIEAGLGAIWDGLDSKENKSGAPHEGQERRNRIMFYGTLGIAVMLACVEGFFYSRYGIVDAPDEISLFGVTLTLMHALGFLGVALPLILFALGHLWHRSLGIMTEKTALTRLKKDLNTCRRSSEAVQGRLPALQEVLKGAQVESEHTVGKLPHFRKDADQEVVIAIQALQQTLENLPNALQKQGSVGGLMSDSEIWRQVRRGKSLILLTLLMGGLSIWLSQETIGRLFPDLNEELTLLLGIIQVLLWLSVGVLLRPTERIVDEQKNIVGGASPWSIAPLLLAIAVLLVVNGYILDQYAIPNAMGLVWGIVMVIQMVFLVLGSEVPEMMGIVRYWLSLLWIRMTWQLRKIGLAAMKLGGVCLKLLELLLEFITLPADLAGQLLQRRRGRPPQET